MTTPCSGCRGRFRLDDRLLVIDHLSDLDVLLRSRGRFDAILVRLDAIPLPEREDWGRRLLAAYSECGCDAGGIALLVALILIAATGLASRGLSWAMGLAFCFAAAFLGKAFGIAIARLTLYRDVQRLRHLSPVSDASAPATSTGKPSR